MEAEERQKIILSEFLRFMSWEDTGDEAEREDTTPSEYTPDFITEQEICLGR